MARLRALRAVRWDGIAFPDGNELANCDQHPDRDGDEWRPNRHGDADELPTGLAEAWVVLSHQLGRDSG